MKTIAMITIDVNLKTGEIGFFSPAPGGIGRLGKVYKDAETAARLFPKIIETHLRAQGLKK